MIRSHHILFIIGIVLLQACASSTTFTSYWNAEGKKNAFHQKEAVYYHPDDQLSVKVFNDDQIADIFIETNSPSTLRKIYNLGLSVWIDPSGKGGNVLGIHYPMPGDILYSQSKFKSYLSRFQRHTFQEELMDRFQAYEIVDSRTNEQISTSTLMDEEYQLTLKTSNQILFSYHIRIPIEKIYPEGTNESTLFSIGVSSVNEANEEYYSALSSKQYINKRLDKLKAGGDQSPEELNEWFVTFKLAKQEQ
jgi:hypothetical protein